MDNRFLSSSAWCDGRVDALDWLHSEHGGVARAAWFIEHGFDNTAQRRHLRDGALVRVRHGWLAVPHANANVVAAVRQGGVLSCVSVFQLWGSWAPRDYGLHVRVDRRHQCLDERTVNHLLPRHLVRQSLTGVDTPLAAAAAVARCLERADAVAVLDSALRLGLFTHESLEYLAGQIQGVGKVVQLLDPSAGSGLESLVRIMLRRLRIRFRTQVLIPEVGVVDFLIGDRLILEVDGREFHDTASGFAKDRLRDANAAALGFLTFRTTYAEVMYSIGDLERRILAVVRSRDHYWSRRNARWRQQGLPCPASGNLASRSHSWPYVA